MHFETPQYSYKEAVLLGNSDKATMLTFIRWSIASKQADHCRDRYKEYYYFDDAWWMQDGYSAWEVRFPWLNKRTINTYLNDLYKKGAILKRAVGSATNGRQPNFYRINPEWDEALARIVGYEDIDALKAKFALGGLEAIFALLESNFCSTPKEKFAHISISNSHTHKSSQNSPPGPADLPCADAPGGELILMDAVDQETYELATQWVGAAKQLLPSQAHNRKWQPMEFYRQFKKIMEKTDLNNAGLRALLTMIPKHKFWATKAVSPFGWLEKSKGDPTMRKIDYILADLRNSKEFREARAMMEFESTVNDPNYTPLF